jgi:hypothetical protein
MKPFGYMNVNHNSPWGYEKTWGRRMRENDVKSQRARQSKETGFLIEEHLDDSGEVSDAGECSCGDGRLSSCSCDWD